MKFVRVRALPAVSVLALVLALVLAGAGCSAGQGDPIGPLEKTQLVVDDFPTAIDPTRLQPVLDDMIQFGFLAKKDASFNLASISYAGNLATTGDNATTGS